MPGNGLEILCAALKRNLCLRSSAAYFLKSCVWLGCERCQHHVQVPVWVERGVLRLPPHHVPLLLVGPGTGVAPFRAFLQERASAAAAGEMGPWNPDNHP